MATRHRVEITKTAEFDIEELWFRIAADSIEHATEFVARLEEAIGTLEKMPQRCPCIPENDLLQADYHHLLLQNYRVIFRITKKAVMVLRVIHGSRLLDTSFFG